MSEYIIEWSGIGARIVELMDEVPACLLTKRLRKERLREPIVRCRECKHYEISELGQGFCIWKYYTDWECEPDGFCAWAQRKEVGE